MDMPSRTNHRVRAACKSAGPAFCTVLSVLLAGRAVQRAKELHHVPIRTGGGSLRIGKHLTAGVEAVHASPRRAGANATGTG